MPPGRATKRRWPSCTVSISPECTVTSLPAWATHTTPRTSPKRGSCGGWKEGARGRSSPLSEALPVDSQGPEEMVANRLVLNEVMKAAETLPEAQRRVISLRFAGGVTVAETARAMGKGEGNVKVIQHKAIAKLRGMVGQG